MIGHVANELRHHKFRKDCIVTPWYSYYMVVWRKLDPFLKNIWNLKFLAVNVNKCLYQIKFTPNVRTVFWATILYLVPWVKLNFGSNIKIWRDFQFMQKARTTGVGYWILFRSMVLILDGNSLIGAHVVIRPVQGIWLHREQSQIRYFYPKRHIFLHACATCNELPSNKSTMPSIYYSK